MADAGIESPAPSFGVTSKPTASGTMVIVTGELDAHTAPQVREVVEAAITPSAQVVVDLTDVTFLDSTGLGVFVTALKHLREVDGTLDLVITSPRVLKVFELTGLDVVIPIHEEISGALGE